MQEFSAVYLFDPLCGWCYGASLVIERLHLAGVELELLPTGLFTGGGAREMDASLAAYAWSNDQRIERLSGQPFSEDYRSKVLNRPGSLFDSGPATLAITAAGLADHRRRLDALRLIQRARYVKGLDITSVPVLAGLFESEGLSEAARLLTEGSVELLDANRQLIAQGQDLFRQHGANGVPALVVEGNGHQRLLNASALFGSYDNLMAHLQAA
ncbi:DsbA family protein (plasmid) [Rhizobium sp. CB3171]|uniref:DsbA family protein n=1 Tax=Rhizobium sp. CB3171 TaxID=3039157 RepID=UPI0024B0CF6A|nr:DsbA family protein [Rhizobium sp. CB3171]WFU05453.1 DsbA family protein [Rhizobium sp. CB3171]